MRATWEEDGSYMGVTMESDRGKFPEKQLKPCKKPQKGMAAI